MAKVAAARGPLPSNSFHYNGGNGVGGGAGAGSSSKVCTTTTTAAVKRKTPSELRGELLKRRNAVERVDDTPSPLLGSLSDGAVCGLKKQEPSKNPRYIDTRMDELFPVRKNSIRLKLLCKKENVKDNISSVECHGSLKTSSVSSDLAVEIQAPVLCAADSLASSEVTKDDIADPHSTAEECSDNIFRSVKELSLGDKKLSGPVNVDMDKALKGLVTCAPPSNSASPAETSEEIGNLKSPKFCSEIEIPGVKIPLDLTLKTTVRVLLSSSVNWFHRLINSGPISGMSHPTPLHSWVYPQSSLPSSVISALSLAEGGQLDFLSKRQLAWEDSFRSLYYMLRKNICNIFYLCTSQFVVMFIGDGGLMGTKRVCNAYISQSTRGLRSLLKEHDVNFSMPFCRSQEEQVTTEDLVELSEIEKHNLGQTRRIRSMSDVDNKPQSLLEFSGNKNAHGLYDFLLNYRFLLSSLTAVDVPMLYSPIPFENASLSRPEIRCKDVRRVDHMLVPLRESNATEEIGSSTGFCYSIEVKDSYLPPWITYSVFDAIGVDGGNFEASFVTEPTSIGLNIGLGINSDKSDSHVTGAEGLEESSHSFGIPNTMYSSHLHSAILKGLKYFNGCCKASLSPV